MGFFETSVYLMLVAGTCGSEVGTVKKKKKKRVVKNMYYLANFCFFLKNKIFAFVLLIINVQNIRHFKINVLFYCTTAAEYHILTT